MNATYTKLRSGDWGIRVQGTANKGDRITVTKKSGESKVETVRNVVWSGNGITLCAIEPRNNLMSMDEMSLAERGLIKVNGPRGEYVRRASREELYDILS